MPAVSLFTPKWKTTRYKFPSPGATLISRDIGRVSEVNNGAVIHDKGGQTVQTEWLADRILQQAYALLNRHDIVPNDVQEQMLTSHVRTIAHWLISDEPLPEVDASLFEEISPDSMTLAREVATQLGNLPDEETWLPSVHFEVTEENP